MGGRMTLAPPGHQVVHFADFALDLRSGELIRDGNRILLPEQPFRILTLLLRQPGSVVTREELRREIWRDEAFVDFEHGLNAAVKRLRTMLGDSATAPRFIETLPRRGYRFIGDLADAPEAPPEIPHPIEPAPNPAPRGPLAPTARAHASSGEADQIDLPLRPECRSRPVAGWTAPCLRLRSRRQRWF